MLKEADGSISLGDSITWGAREAPSFNGACHQETPAPRATVRLTSLRLSVHHYLVEIEAIYEGPPDFTRGVCDELLFQHFLEGETTKLWNSCRGTSQRCSPQTPLSTPISGDDCAVLNAVPGVNYIIKCKCIIQYHQIFQTYRKV